MKHYGQGKDCRITVKRGDYPYDCIAKDKRPDAMVAQCATHRVWWVQEEDK